MKNAVGNDEQPDLRIVPNPFDAQTSLRFFAPANSSVRIVVNDAAGREVAVLLEAKGSGEQTVEWDTSLLRSGMYHVSLFIDEELIVKRAVKTAR